MELIKVMFLTTVQEIDQLSRDTDDQSALFYRTETT